MSTFTRITISGRASRLFERAIDRVGVLVLLVLGVSTAGATLLVGV